MSKRPPARSGRLAAGDVLGPYRLHAPLGEGGMGQVFRATHDDGTEVAIKVMRAELVGSEMHGRRFQHEARAAGALRHRHLVGVVDVGEADGVRYLAMPLITGASLLERLERVGRLPMEEAVAVTCGVAAGLDALHGAGVVHRDIKPSNIMVDEEGRALLMDFGLSKGHGFTRLTQTGQVVGTLDYLAPEVLRGEEPSAASDIYALGCVVFECLAGAPPFASKSMAVVGRAHLKDDPPDPCHGRADASPVLTEVVLHALAKRPEERPPTATAYARMLSVTAGAS